jgi:hypothetical protein
MGKRKVKARSGFEKRIMKDLDKRKVKYEYEPYRLSYTVQRKYTPDLKLPNGVLVEVKGRFTSADRTKFLSVRDQHRHEDIRLLFQADNKLNKNSTTRYSDWCDKHDIIYHVGNTVPDEWLK